MSVDRGLVLIACRQLGAVGRDRSVVQGAEIASLRKGSKVMDVLARAALKSPMNSAYALRRPDENAKTTQLGIAALASIGSRFGPAAARMAQLHEQQRYTLSNICSIARSDSPWLVRQSHAAARQSNGLVRSTRRRPRAETDRVLDHASAVVVTAW